MTTYAREMPELELALLKRGLGELAGTLEHCHSCDRGMLIGERVYEYDNGDVRCALCREHERRSPASSHTVHTGAHGNSIRMLDRRAAKRAA